MSDVKDGTVLALAGALNIHLGVTVVMFTPDLTTIFTLCNRIAVLVDGKVIIDTVQGLMQSAQPWMRST